jgi:signal transduction histidine kinase
VTGRITDAGDGPAGPADSGDEQAGPCVRVAIDEVPVPTALGARDGGPSPVEGGCAISRPEAARDPGASPTGDEWTRLFVAERLAKAEALAARGRLAFLDELSVLLADTLDGEAMLAGLVRLAVPALGDWAGVWVRGEDGAPALAAAAGAAATGDALRSALAADPERRLERALGGEAPDAELAPVPPVHAAALVPLTTHGRTLGALAVAAEGPAERYRAADLALLGDVARRAALHLDHARAYQEATRAVAIRDEFLQVAAHELRGPIGTLNLGVASLSRALRRGAAGERQLDLVERQMDRLVRVSAMLLDLTRLSAGRLELAREPIDLADLACEVFARLEPDAVQAGVAVELLAERPALVHGDPARLDQAITNLAANALKHAPGHPVTVRVGREGARVRLSVRDRGPGIAAADQARIFARFERAAPARGPGGLGLGLWIARGVVEAHGGTLSVESAPGEGATFTIDLPAL